MHIFLCFLLVLWGVTPTFAQSGAPSADALRDWLQSEGSATATGTSTAFNPAISVNGLFLGFYTSSPFARASVFGDAHLHEGEEDFIVGDHVDAVDHTDEEDHEEGHAHGLPEYSGMRLQEAEVRFSAVVDAYFKADMTLAISGTENIELEEGVLETTSLPNVTLKAGKFYGALGKHNHLHTHAFPFVDAPIANEKILGGEGLNEVGMGASILLPMAWFSEFQGQVLNGDNALFNSAEDGDLAYLGRWTNLWDMSDNATLAMGGSYVFGKNEHSKWTHVWGGDVTFKWRPARRVGDRGLVLQAEYLQARVNEGRDIEKVGGLYALMQYQFARRWWAQARYDVFGVPKVEPIREYRWSGLLAYAPSEFSAIRVQYNLNRESGKNVHQFVAQLNFTMGAHPAHAY
jgi:hypothetical protein